MAILARFARTSWFGANEADDLIRRWQRRLTGPLWSVLEYAWYPGLLFATTPLFLHRLGPALFGQWSLLVATAGLGVILNVGTGAATVRLVAAALPRGGAAAANRVVRAALVPAVIGGGLAALLIVGVFAIGASSWLARMGNPAETILTGVFAALLLAIDQIDNVFTSTLRGGERFREIARLEMVTRTVQLAAAALAVAIFGTLIGLYAALSIAAVARTALRAWSVRRWLGGSFRPFERSGLRGLLGEARWGWMLGAGGLAFGLADRFIVGSLLGAVALTHYSVATQLAQPLHALIAAATSVIFPKVSAATARGDGRQMRRLLSTAFILLSATATAGACVLFVCRNLILRLWLGTSVAAAAGPALGWLTAAYWLLAIAVLPHYVLLGIGRMRFVALVNLAAGLLTCVAMVVGARWYGVEGVAAARLVYGICLMGNLVPIVTLWKRDAWVAEEN